MGLFTKISQNAFEEMQLDAGMLLTSFDPATPAAPADADIICATTGGIEIACTPEYSDLAEDVDNAPNGLIEYKHLDSWTCTLGFTALGTSPAAIKLALGAADIDVTDLSKVTPRRDLNTSDARDIWWVGDRADGGFVAVKVKKALSTGGLSLKTEKNGKGQISCELTGHVSVANQDAMPMEFYSVEG